MKKSYLFIAFALVVSFVQAQNNTLEVLGHNFSTTFEYNNVPYNAQLTKTYNMIEKPDGNILIVNLYRRKLHPSSPVTVNIGDGFYTISREEVAVADSTFLESNIEYDEDNGSTLLVRDPLGEGYIYVKFLYERVSYPGWDGFTWLEIFHAGEDLNFNHNPVMVPLEDVHIESSKGIMLDDEENMVVRYVTDGVPVFARVGLDGTMKDKQPMPGLFQGASWKINGMVTYSDTPREYAIYGWDMTPEGDTTFLFHVVDSLFNLQETAVLGGEFTDADILKNTNEAMKEHFGGDYAFAMLDVTECIGKSDSSNAQNLLLLLDGLWEDAGKEGKFSDQVGKLEELKVTRYLTAAGSGENTETNCVLKDETLYLMEYQDQWYVFYS